MIKKLLMGLFLFHPACAIDIEALKIGAAAGGALIACGTVGGASLEVEAQGRFFDPERASTGAGKNFLHGAKEGFKASLLDAAWVSGAVALASRLPVDRLVAPSKVPFLTLNDLKIPLGLYAGSAVLLYCGGSRVYDYIIKNNYMITVRGEEFGAGAEGLAKVVARPDERNPDVIRACVSRACASIFFDKTVSWIPSALLMWRISKIK